MAGLQLAIRFTENHDIYNAGEVAAFDLAEGERLISIGAGVPDSGVPEPNQEQEFVPAKKEQVKSTPRGRAAQGHLEQRPDAEVLVPDEDPRSEKSRAERIAIVDAYLKDPSNDKAYLKAYEAGYRDAAREVPPPPQPVLVQHRQSEAPRSGKALQGPQKDKQLRGAGQTKKQGRGAGERAVREGKQAADLGTGVGGSGKAPNQARDTRTADRNRGAPLGPSSPKESGRLPGA